VVPHHARAAGVIRQRMATELTPLISTELLGDSMTVTAELVGNAVRHAQPLPGEVIQVAWRLYRHLDDGQTVDIRVTDGGATYWPRVQYAPPEATDGRGLAIVAALAAGWGVHRDGQGQCVWATLVEAAMEITGRDIPARDILARDIPARDTSARFGADRATRPGSEP